jgi:hypothetical protein
LQGPWINTRKYCLSFERLIDFSTTYAIPFSQIPNYVKQKADEKQKVEEKIKIKGQIEMLTLEKSDRQFLRDQALQDERMIATELKWYLISGQN